MFAHAYIDTDPDGKTIVRANTETHTGHTLAPALVSLRTVIRLADQLGLIILDPELNTGGGSRRRSPPSATPSSRAAGGDEKLGQLTAAERDAAKDRARTARLDANVKVRAAELALQRAHRNHRDTAPYLAAANRADEAYQAARAELDKYEPRRDPFANLPGGGVDHGAEQ